MTDEIIKLYENAGIKPIKQGYCDWDSDCPYPDIINNGCGDECPYWKYEDEAKYPPFTAEKQIAILQLLTKQCDLTISHFTEWEFIHFDGQEPTQVTGKDFAETFAKLINAYWQDLTEEEKQQVKGILE
jgi:hypothetical protein